MPRLSGKKKEKGRAKKIVKFFEKNFKIGLTCATLFGIICRSAIGLILP